MLESFISLSAKSNFNNKDFTNHPKSDYCSESKVSNLLTNPNKRFQPINLRLTIIYPIFITDFISSNQNKENEKYTYPLNVNHLFNKLLHYK